MNDSERRRVQFDTATAPHRLVHYRQRPGSRGMFTAVLDAIRSSHLNAEFEFVFVSRERGQTAPTDSFLDLTEANNIETVTLSSHRFRRDNNGAAWSKLREAYDNAVLSALDGFTPDISVMAGYMLYAPEISRRMLVLNQHPALPVEPSESGKTRSGTLSKTMKIDTAR